MGGMEATDKSSSAGQYVWAGARLLLGYCSAVAVGATLFSLLMSFSSPASETALLAMLCFGLGLMFAAPYAVAGCLALKFMLPRNRLTFLVVGTFCPAAAILTLLVISGATLRPSPELLKILLPSIPVGLVSTWVFGAVGVGEWRFR